ncbi:MAG: exodeoxyribonuclease VII large subunit [Muribaculaceae bacterium]|nr:exodeoxyribonuclease VII large subunit [Muribaculaceae bacterium]
MTGSESVVRGAITVYDLCRRVQGAVAASAGLQNVWVMGETSDLRTSGGHCYLELIDKDEQGTTRARIRANIWANVWRSISASFLAATGMQLTSGIKILACVSVSYHPVYGVAVVVTAVDPTYTMGEAVRRRNEILKRLQEDGILMMNRELTWLDVPMRIAVISASGAAGYGDFINQLYTNRLNLNFHTRLYPAVLQGDRTAPTVIAALDNIAADSDNWDCVVIIRGGGSTSDLAAFDNYELAAHVAQFPLPVIVGIGHERDVTVLDYVANMRVKTPTAAAEWLVATATSALNRIENLGNIVYKTVTDRINGDRQQLAYISAVIPGSILTRLTMARGRIDNIAVGLASVGSRHIAPQKARIDYLVESLKVAPFARLNNASNNLNAYQALIKALSPEAVLARGFSMTTDAQGRVVKSVSQVKTGDVIYTSVADGLLTSTIDILKYKL